MSERIYSLNITYFVSIGGGSQVYFVKLLAKDMTEAKINALTHVKAIIPTIITAVVSEVIATDGPIP